MFDIATFLLPVVAAKDQQRLSGLSADFTLYAAAFRLLVYFVSEYGPIWGSMIFGLMFLVVGALHLHARDN